MSIIFLAGCEKYETDTYGKYKKIHFHDDENAIFYNGCQTEGDTDITEEKLMSALGLNSEESDYTIWRTTGFYRGFEYYKDKDGYYYKERQSESGGYSYYPTEFYQFQINKDGSVIWNALNTEFRGQYPISFIHKFGNLYIDFPYLDNLSLETMKAKIVSNSTLRPLLITDTSIILEAVQSAPYLCYVRVKLIKESN